MKNGYVVKMVVVIVCSGYFVWVIFMLKILLFYMKLWLFCV